MVARKKKGNPELNVVSFCDIVTVSMVALFMALVIVIDQAMRTPNLRPTPLTVATTNAPVYFEFRRNQLYRIDRAELMGILRESARELRRQQGGTAEGVLQTAMSQDIGNRFYRLDNGFLMMGVVALLPRADVPGLPEASFDQTPNPIEDALKAINTNSQYAVFLVRDDSWPVFRRTRDLSIKLGVMSGWEYLGRDEPITFEGMFARIKAD